MYCPKCGAYNDNENIWCVYCGHGKLPVITEKENSEKENGSDTPETDDTINTTCKNMETIECIENVTGTKKAKVHGGDSGCRWKVEKNEVKDFLVLSIISAVFGSFIFGVAAIIFSAMTKSENEAGNYIKAKDYSAKAKLFSIIALVVGASKYIFAIALIALFISGSFFYLF